MHRRPGPRCGGGAPLAREERRRRNRRRSRSGRDWETLCLRFLHDSCQNGPTVDAVGRRSYHTGGFVPTMAATPQPSRCHAAEESAPLAAAIRLPLEWRLHPARREPARAALLVGIIAASALLGALSFDSWLLGGATAFLLTGATAEFLLPTRYRITREGAEQRNLFAPRRIRWAEVKRAYLTEDGIKLSPLGRPSRLESTRGVFLRFADNRSEVIAAVRFCRDEWRHRTDAGTA